ncbi:transcription factor [Ganoderma sinense ZZ0214-1]|uniref:Transcription factor n=1 Tax=Ganoderma sinense ZZ0214-1 TaxID=1077348 RepID=A0A2G8SE04_9APHY|nr:transcription factor [Ganoderma sinense ZZ0214-1]
MVGPDITDVGAEPTPSSSALAPLPARVLVAQTAFPITNTTTSSESCTGKSVQLLSAFKEPLMASALPLTFNQAVRGIAEFIEVAIHTILYVRQVYPADIFIRRRKYDTPVFQSRHPALNEYIAGAIKAITDEISLGNVDKVVVVIKDAEEQPLERFIFAVHHTLDVEGYNKDTSVDGALSVDSMGQYFRSALVKLNMIEAQLGQICLDDLSFAILLELLGDKAPTASHGRDPPPWIPATTQHTTSSVSDAAELHMVRAVDTGIINLSLAVQESEHKLSLLKDAEETGKDKAPT